MSDGQKPPKPIEYVFGDLPVLGINKALGLDLEVAEVVLTANAERHIRKKPDHEFDACLPYVADTIRDPGYVGDDFKNPGKIELIRRMPDKRGLLVAVEMTLNSEGRYSISTFYPLTEKQIQARRNKGFLKIMPK